MKQAVVAKLTNKSRSYVSKVKNNTITNQQIENLLAITDEDFLYTLLADPLMSKICRAAIMHCKKDEERLFASKLYHISEKLRRKE